jgi:HAD superfamily hydrolase (TIGR01509 family)
MGFGMDVDLVIFDCDGVLVDSEFVSFEAESEALAEVGIRVPPRALLARFLGTSSRAMFATLAREHGVALPADFAERTAERTFAVFDSRLQAISGVADLLAGLVHRKCVASSSEPERIRHALSLTGLLRHFGTHIFSATEVARGKPAPDLFLLAARRMGAIPARCLVIEDSVAGVTAARAAGMNVLGFTGASHCLEGHARMLLQAGARETFGSYPELALRLGVST